MTVTFVLKDKDSNTLKEYILQSSDKILDLKIMIVKDQYENKGNVNINLLIERTKRVFGKFNLEPGMLPVSFDNSSLDKFALKDGEIINIKVEHIDRDIKQNKALSRNSSKKKGAYIPPNNKKISNFNKSNKNSNSTKNNKKPFSLKDKDFPSL
jgi:hypothetical protein